MKVQGICKICKQEKMLNYEHFPPRSAFNKETRFFSVPQNDYFYNFLEYINPLNYENIKRNTPKSKRRLRH